MFYFERNKTFCKVLLFVLIKDKQTALSTGLFVLKQAKTRKPCRICYSGTEKPYFWSHYLTIEDGKYYSFHHLFGGCEIVLIPVIFPPGECRFSFNAGYVLLMRAYIIIMYNSYRNLVA